MVVLSKSSKQIQIINSMSSRQSLKKKKKKSPQLEFEVGTKWRSIMAPIEANEIRNTLGAVFQSIYDIV